MFPKIIQGGMGVNISSYLLAKTVSKTGMLGTVSGVAFEKIFAYILQKGDPNKDMRRALSHFPFQNIVKKVMDAFYVEGGTKERLKKAPVFIVKPSDILVALTVCANYALVWLAKEGHRNPVSINYLEKIAMPHLYAITGAMLAGVNFITMGAGIPLQIPDVIEKIASNSTAVYKIPVFGKNISSHEMSFDPKSFFGEKMPCLEKPGFIPIISSNLLASILIKKLPKDSIFGFVVEEWTAGGHNAPPRNGEEYGPKDVTNYQKVAETNLPFWIGGSKSSPEKLKWALSVGACGIQVGSMFALAEESGMDPVLRKKICRLGFEGRVSIKTDKRFSPTGFPFKIAEIADTLSDDELYENRIRICDQGGLVSLYEKEDGSIGYRCPSESPSVFLAKGGNEDDVCGRGCLCNGLISTAGFGSGRELPVVTLGDDLSFLKKIMSNPSSTYGVKEVLDFLLG